MKQLKSLLFSIIAQLAPIALMVLTYSSFSFSGEYTLPQYKSGESLGQAQVDPCSILLIEDLKPRTEVITGAEGAIYKLPYRFNNEPRLAEGAEQIEYERRANYQKPDLDLRSDDTFVREKISEMLNIYFLRYTRPKAAGFKLAPLGSRVDFFHYDYLHTRYTNGVEKPEDFNVEITAPRVELGQSLRRHDYLDPIYIVGLQNEKSIYFDLDDGLLERNNIAVRVKSWYPAEAATLAGVPSARSVFLKQTLGEYGPFVLRREIHVKVSPTATAKEILSVAQQLVAQEFPIFKDEIARLREQVEIINRRYSVNIYKLDTSSYHAEAQRGEKVGFMTFDTFTSRKIEANNETPASAPTFQIEYEVFAPYGQTATDDFDSLNVFFTEVETRLGAKMTEVPKYRQGQ